MRAKTAAEVHAVLDILASFFAVGGVEVKDDD